MLIRPLTPEDKPLIESWIQAEPGHSDNTFEWYGQEGTKSLMFSDDSGDVLVAKFTPCLRIDIDFNPEASPLRTAKVMSKGLSEMEKQARSQGFKEFVFDSLSERLSAFCTRLGFVKSPEMRKVFRD